MPGGRNGRSEKMRRAVQQKIEGGMTLISKGVHRGEISKAQLRSMIPVYDEAIVKRIPPRTKRKTSS
jgi:hypothetical protein